MMEMVDLSEDLRLGNGMILEILEMERIMGIEIMREILEIMKIVD
jgi:uncharacterized protein YuzE